MGFAPSLLTPAVTLVNSLSVTPSPYLAALSGGDSNVASLPARDGRTITGYCPCRRRQQTGNPILSDGKPTVGSTSVLCKVLFQPAATLGMLAYDSAAGELLELTVPGEAAAAEVLARHRQDVAPAWFRPGNTDCNGGRSSRPAKTKYPAQQGLAAIFTQGFALGRPTKATARHVCNSFLCHTHLIQSRDHRWASENVNRAPVSMDGWIWVSY